MLEKIVTSLEASRGLKELGIIQESIFHWVHWKLPVDKWEIVSLDEFKKEILKKNFQLDLDEILKSHIENNEIISAFTATELGVMRDYDGIQIRELDSVANEVICGVKFDDDTIDELNQNLKEWRKK